MPPSVIATSIVAIALEALILMGLCRDRLYRASYGFVAYLSAVMLGDCLGLLRPQVFLYPWSVWLFRETVYAVLKLATALELAGLVFQSFPGAAASARRAILASLGFAFALLALGVPSAPDLQTLVSNLLPRLAEGTVLVFCAVWGAALWYHLPLHRVHKAILRGLVPYLLAFTIARGLIVSLGWHVWEWANMADILAYLVALTYWAWEAWRPAPPESEFLRELQPWRARL